MFGKKRNPLFFISTMLKQRVHSLSLLRKCFFCFGFFLLCVCVCVCERHLVLFTGLRMVLQGVEFCSTLLWPTSLCLHVALRCVEDSRGCPSCQNSDKQRQPVENRPWFATAHSKRNKLWLCSACCDVFSHWRRRDTLKRAIKAAHASQSSLINLFLHLFCSGSHP